MTICSRRTKENLMGRAIDLFVTYRFLKLLTTYSIKRMRTSILSTGW